MYRYQRTPPMLGVAVAAVIAIGIVAPHEDTVPPPEVEARQGRVVAWYLADDGTVYLQLAVESDRDLWFQAPAERTTNTDFEAMLMDLVLATRDESSALRELTIHSEPDPERDGSSRAKARWIVGVSGE